MHILKKMRFSLRMHLTIGIKATFSKDEGTSFEQFHARYSNDMTADHSNEIYKLSISCYLIISFLYNFFLFIILFISILVIFSSTHFFFDFIVQSIFVQWFLLKINFIDLILRDYHNKE